jgi:enoyl-CoA hydratase/carnithine racemase
MAPTPSPLSLPSSYISYSAETFDSIKLSHHPASAPTATPIIILTLYRPKANNAWTDHMGDEMMRAFNMFDVDDRVKVIVVTGNGRFFCPGADLNIGFGGRKDSGQVANHRDGYVAFINRSSVAFPTVQKMLSSLSPSSISIYESH